MSPVKLPALAFLVLSNFDNFVLAKKRDFQDNFHARIVGGQDADRDEYPFYGKNGQQATGSDMCTCLRL